jgi:plasmid maintenance system killer protein
MTKLSLFGKKKDKDKSKKNKNKGDGNNSGGEEDILSTSQLISKVNRKSWSISSQNLKDANDKKDNITITTTRPNSSDQYNRVNTGTPLDDLAKISDNVQVSPKQRTPTTQLKLNADDSSSGNRNRRPSTRGTKLPQLQQQRMSMSFYNNREYQELLVNQRREMEQLEHKEQMKKRLEFARQTANDDDLRLLETNNNTLLEAGSSLDMSEIYTTKTFEAFDNLRNLSREINVTLPTPEFVVIGKRSHGKSALIESLVGYTINHVNKDPASRSVTTMRPIVIHLLYNGQYKETPQCTLYYYENRDDSSTADETEDSHSRHSRGSQELFVEKLEHTGRKVSNIVSIEKVSTEIEKLMQQQQAVTNNPIYLQMEYAYFFNMIIIDTPGILTKSGSDSDNTTEIETIDNIVYDYITPAHRQIIALEEASAWSEVDVLNYVKNVDPSFTRTTVVFSKFHSLLKALGTDELQRFFQLTPRMTQFFFVSLFSTKIRKSLVSNRDQYLETVKQAYIRDNRILDHLNYDKRYRDNIGLFRFRNFIFYKAYLEYQSTIPEMLNNIRSSIRRFEHKLDKLNKEPLSRLIGSSSSSSGRPARNLRKIATEYTNTFLKTLKDVLSGTCRGLPSETGQKLQEEIESGAGPWLDPSYQEVKPDASQIQFSDAHVYGGQQFRRLLHEFVSICTNTPLGELTVDDYASASGVTTGTNASGIYWAASEIVSQRLLPAMKGYLQQLLQRASYLVKHLQIVVDRVLIEDKKRSLKRGVLSQQEFSRYPFFKTHMSVLFEEFIDNLSKTVQQKCMDEFLSTRAVYWSALMDLKDLEMDLKHVDSAVQTVTDNIFQSTKTRMSKNISMKMFNFFFMPLETDLWNHLHNKLAMLSDDQLEQIFELHIVTEKIMTEKTKLKEELEISISQEMDFMKNSALFSEAFKRLIQGDDLSVKLEPTTNDKHYKYNLHGLEAERWHDQRANFQEQQKQMQAAMEKNEKKIELRKQIRRSTIRTHSPLLSPNSVSSVGTPSSATTPVMSPFSENELEVTNSIISDAAKVESVDSDTDSDDEYYNDQLDDVIDALESNDPPVTEVNLEQVKDDLKIISDFQMQDFAKSLGKNTTLKTLNLSGKGVNDRTLNMINICLKNSKSLTSLDLSSNEIDGNVVQSLCNLIETCNSLTSLNLDRTYIPVTGFDELLKAMKTNKKLVDVKFNQFASKDNLEKLKVILQSNRNN